jgi:hypothetical protein
MKSSVEKPPLSVVPEKVILLKIKNAAAFLILSNDSIFSNRNLYNSFPSG